MSLEIQQVYDKNCLKLGENQQPNFKIQVLQDNQQQINFKEYVEQLQNQDHKEELAFMDAALQEIGYKSIRFAGKGSFGTVIIGEDQNKNRFAFKLISIRTIQGNINKDKKNQAQKEAQIMSQMDHSNVVKFYKSYETFNYFIIQMEECKGDLYKLIEINHFLSLESFIKYGKEISEGIQYIHDKGLVLRDLKPDNILIDKMNVAKVADFGLAAHVMRGTSRVNYSFQGAISFRAPELQNEICQQFFEQLKQEDSCLVQQSKKSDCFSLGLIFCFCLGASFEKLFDIIKQGPSKIDTPANINSVREQQCIDRMLKLLCEQHPNKRMSIQNVIIQFEILQNQYLSSQMNQYLSSQMNQYLSSQMNQQVLIQTQPISNQKIIMLAENQSGYNQLADNIKEENEKSQI
ncbi:hypothetical protein ABPG72_021283 [Tetrahymena utriculariae]